MPPLSRLLLVTSLPVLLAIITVSDALAGNPRFEEAVSRDGTQVAYVNATDGDSEIYIEAADGTGRRRLTDNDSYDNTPTFSPDGRQIAFASNRSGQWQIYTMNTAGEELTQITDQETGCIMPKFGPNGQLAYLIQRGQRVKRKLFDLVVRDGEQVTRLQEKIPVWSLAWQHQGRVIVCATDGQIVLHDLEHRTTQTITFADTDPRLGPFGVFDLHWNIEQNGFVGRLRFLGGIPQGSRVFGDGETFLLTPKGDFRFQTITAEKSTS